MVSEYKLSIYKGTKAITFKYICAHYPITDTEVLLYDAYKLNIMLSDGLAAILNDRNDIYNTFSGDLLFFNPSEIHHGKILRQGIHKYIEILIPTEYFPDCKSYYSIFNDTTKNRTNHLSPEPKDKATLIEYAEKIIRRIKNPDHDNDIVLFTDLIEIIKICDKLYQKKESGNQNIPATLKTATDFIKKEFSFDIQVSDIARASNCSQSYLSRIFKKHMGISPYSYLTEYRLFNAEKLLRNGCSVTDAAMLSGFYDTSVFIKNFKKSFGTTPLKYKKTTTDFS